MSLEGRLTIDLSRLPDGSGDVRIASSRPFGLTRAFAGKSVDETVRMLPLLFNVCGLAQGAGAADAAERAMGCEVASETQRARSLLVLAETAREHLIRALADWPRLIGQTADNTSVLPALKSCEALRQAIDPSRTAMSIGATSKLDTEAILHSISALSTTIESTVLGESIERFEARRTALDLESWHQPAITPAQCLVGLVIARGWSGAGNAETRFLPRLPDDELAQRLLDDECEDFAAAPTWMGAPHETSALSRQAAHPLIHLLSAEQGSGLLTRLAARLVEIAALPGKMSAIARLDDALSSHGQEAQVRGSSPRPGCGLTQVEAARGRLVHGVAIRAETVARYAILAPTEWNFHPEGPARRGLAEIAGGDGDVREIAELFITALDPCVGYEVRVH